MQTVKNGKCNNISLTIVLEGPDIASQLGCDTCRGERV